jgi:hypothetical protein
MFRLSDRPSSVAALSRSPWRWSARRGLLRRGARGCVVPWLMGLWLGTMSSAHAQPVTDREETVLRAGVIARIFMSPALEARGTFLPAIATPDPLGSRRGDAFLQRIRYHWATGP